MTTQGARRTTIWVAVLAACLAVLALPLVTAGASAAPVATGASGTQQWAYGASEWQNTSLTFGNGSLSEKAHFAWAAIYTRTATSNTSHAWEVQQTEAGDLFGQFCSSNCSNANSTRGNLSIQGWEQVATFFNTTSTATVLLNGSLVPAYGVTNESFAIAGNLTESADWSWVSLAGSPESTSTYFAVALTGTHQIQFTPALGILPQNVSVGDNWSANANYSASGAWDAAVTFAHTGVLGHTTVLRNNDGGNLTLSGSLTLWGADVGTLTLRNGQVTQIIVLGTDGPFLLHDGVIFLPGVLDLFAVGGSHPWDSDAQGLATLRSDRVDVASNGGALAIVSESTGVSGAASAIQPSGPSTVSPAASGGPSAEMQSQPEAVPVAEASASCMVGHCGGTTGASGLGGSSLLLAVVVGVAIAAVIGTFGVVEYRSWASRTHRSKSLVGSLPLETQHPVAPGAILTQPTRPADQAAPTPVNAPAFPPRSPPGGPSFPPQ
jgi:hypothetical protein